MGALLSALRLSTTASLLGTTLGFGRTALGGEDLGLYLLLDLAIKLFGTLALLGEVLSELFLLALEILDLGGALDFFLLELTLLRFTEGEELLLLRMGASHLSLSSFDLGAGAT